MAVVELAEAFALGSDAERQAAAPQLAAALAKAAASGDKDKENSCSRETLQAGQQCFKAAQQRLTHPQSVGEGLPQLVAVGRASLAALAALSPATAAQQLAGWRYNFARRLVSCRAFEDAQAEAWVLFQLLGKLQPSSVSTGSSSRPSGPPAGEAANLMVGTALTLVLCCVEGRLFDSDQALQGMLQAAESLPAWLSQLEPEEAGKHGDAAHRYLYKAAVLLLERRAWQPLPAVCSSLLAVAGEDMTVQQRAVQAVGKLVVHMPEQQAAVVLAALAVRAGSLGLSNRAALDLLGLLCSAVQHASTAMTSQYLRQAVLSCSAAAAPAGSSQLLLQTAALLLPALAMQLPGSMAGAWLEPAAAAVHLVTGAMQQLEEQQAAAQPLPLDRVQRTRLLLEAAFMPANTLRRLLATADKANSSNGGSSYAELVLQFGGAAGARLASLVLELLGGMVGVCSRLDSDPVTTLSRQGHAAAVCLVIAARLRAACLVGGVDDDQLCSSRAVSRLLGWDLQTYCAGSTGLPPAACVVELQELPWMASALFNVGVDLHATQLYTAAASAMQAAVSTAAVGLRGLAVGGADQDAASLRLADFCRKAVALSEAQQRASNAPGALSSLAHCTAMLLGLGFVAPSAWQPLVQAFVRLHAELKETEEQQQQVLVAATQPTRRGRGAASIKIAAAIETSSRRSSQFAGDLLLVSALLPREAELPDGSIATAIEQELQCWAALTKSPLATSGSASALCRQVVRQLLQGVFPAVQRPVEHAGILLALHQLDLPAEDGQSGGQLLERAADTLEKAPHPAAASMLARARCLLAVHSARQLTVEALLEQQQERKRSHAAASTSAAGSREQDVAALARLAGSGVQSDGPAWQLVGQQAQQALEALQAVGDAAAEDGTMQAAREELSWLMGLHGASGAAPKQLHDVLSSCLFPAAAGSAVDLQQQADTAATEGGRSSATVVHRAALHRQAAEAFAAAGDMVPALYHASEAHRLLATLFHEGTAVASGPSASSDAPPVGWWQLAAAYLGSLLHLGQLFEAAGLADEALHALREGQRLAVAAGAWPLAAMFAARLADIYCKQGQLQAAEQAVAIAEQQLAAVPAGPGSLSLDYCRAAVQLVAAQFGVASSVCGGSGSKAAWSTSQEAASSCEELAEAAAVAATGSGQQASAAASWCGALHCAALLTVADAALQRDDKAAALEHAAAALAAAAGNDGSACSALRWQQATALLFLGQHSAPQAVVGQQLAVWGLGQASSNSAPSASSAEAPAVPRGRTRRAPAKQATGRSRNKAAAAGAEDGAAAGSPASAPCIVPQHQQQLWEALELCKGLLCMHRPAAALLAEACGRAGYLHLAAWLLHSSLGAAMRLQYQLVLHSRHQQLLQRRRRAGDAAGGADLASQAEELHRLADGVLGGALDWQFVQQLAGYSGGAAAQLPAVAPAGRGKKAAAAQASKVMPCDPDAALAALDQQARQQLLAWQAALPAGTAACSVSTLPGSSGGSLLICRLAPAGSGAAEESTPPLLVALPVQQLSASLSQHPIRALRMDNEPDSAGTPVSSVQSVLDEMAAVLADSGRSMREMCTDTREQQREWWRARLSLDDRLAALVKHLDSSWLGPWRGLLLGDPPDSGSDTASVAAAQHLLELLAEAGQPASQLQAAVLQHATAVLARLASSGGMTASEQRQAAHQLCHVAGLVCSQGQQQEVAALLAAPPLVGGASAAAAEQADEDMPDAVARQPAGKAMRAGRKLVKFTDQVDPAEEVQQQQQQVQKAAAVQPEVVLQRPAARAGRGRKPAAARGWSGAAAAAAVEEPVDGGSADGINTSPIATLATAGSSMAATDEVPVTQGGLCHVFDGLSLEEEADTGTAAPAAAVAAAAAAAPGMAGAGTTGHSSKHRSRLRMMQASTPGSGVARKLRAAAGAAATAPRPARELPLTVAKTEPPPAARPSGGAASARAATAAGPVLLVLDGALQMLPWESLSGLLHQRLYRMPSMACAAASAHRADQSVDLGSTFYSLNPGGDLEATQATFQAWFAGMHGWEGKAGSAPSAAELAAALTSHQFFLYCGHGGGEQYISAAKLRSLERCSAALLMGCSSGRLRVQQHYEPVGAVLAYLLAGCPSAVANLWDVTDKDIDRFSQALLTAWIGGAGADSGGNSSDISSRGSSRSITAAERGGAAAHTGSDMSAALAGSRAACKLPHLVGAAPVCYGIPSRLVFAAP